MDATKLENLLNSYVDEALSADAKRDLEQMLLDSAESRELFWKQAQLHALIRECYEAQPGQCLATSAGRAFVESLDSMPARGTLTQSQAPHAPACAKTNTPINWPTLSIPGSLGDTWHGTVSSFSSGWPIAYLVATVILGLGFLVGGLVHVSTPVQVVRQPAPCLSPLAPSSSSQPFVGRITGMVDCKWEKTGTDPIGAKHPQGRSGGHRPKVGRGLSPVSPQSPESRVQKNLPSPSGRGAGGEGSPQLSSLVSLGDTFALSSGLLEITYETGAKVILQGPCTYEVESKTGGFLSLGKLTARLEKKSHLPSASGRGAGDEGGESSIHPSSFILHPLFSVRTPTATITDLGTEFGVEVSKEGNTTSHVFRGSVEVRRVTDRRPTGDPIRLTENESVQVSGQDDDKLSANRSTTAPTDFVRSEQLKELIRRDQQSKLVRTPPLRWPLLDKTLVAWVSLDNLEQQGVGVLSIVNMPEFDGIVFGELQPRKWMASSCNFARTEQNQSGYPTETSKPDELVQIAVVYEWNVVTIYRNGEEYAQFNVEYRHAFRRDSILLIGKRHMDDGHTQPATLAGTVEEVRLYNVALSPKTIASLKPNEPSPIGPVGCWTFDDGTPRDSAKHFPLGELHGNARVSNGKLVLDGADSYLLVPAATRTKSPSGNSQGNRQSTLSGRTFAVPKSQE